VARPCRRRRPDIPWPDRHGPPSTPGRRSPWRAARCRATIDLRLRRRRPAAARGPERNTTALPARPLPPAAALPANRAAPSLSNETRDDVRVCSDEFRKYKLPAGRSLRSVSSRRTRVGAGWDAVLRRLRCGRAVSPCDAVSVWERGGLCGNGKEGEVWFGHGQFDLTGLDRRLEP
jgi:hypothetical protein